jgi:hypothetical protein
MLAFWRKDLSKNLVSLWLRVSTSMVLLSHRLYMQGMKKSIITEKNRKKIK